jgi:hypothetical protein
LIKGDNLSLATLVVTGTTFGSIALLIFVVLTAAKKTRRN